MTERPIRNIVASIHQRLLNISRIQNRPFNDILQLYALERWLYRLSQSTFRERFVLKGALLLIAWKTPSTRPTRDIDLLGRLNNDLEIIRGAIANINRTSVDDDGLEFDGDSVSTETIAEDADYEGVRAKFQGQLGNSRIAMQVDIGFSDVMTPGPIVTSYPTFLEQPAAELLAYNRETAIAEKFEALVKLGELNSRMKDFFDIWLLARTFAFDGAELAAAIESTFAQRQTPLELAPVCFSERFTTNPDKGKQWKAFLRRGQINPAPEFAGVVAQIREFLQPMAEAIERQLTIKLEWNPGGPWTAKSR